MLDATKTKVANNGAFGARINLKQMWIPPGDNPLASSAVHGPDMYYRNIHWQFIWKPFQQFGKYVELKQIACIHGCGAGNLETKGLRWRPQIKYSDIVWVLHDRIQCKCCGKYTSTIDPCFLALLPTVVAEQLPFITTAAGPGIDRSMLYMLNSLKTKQIMEGSFAGVINELLRIAYDFNRVSYYDRIALTAEQDSIGHFAQPVKPPYSAFNYPGDHNGIKVTAAMLTAEAALSEFSSDAVRRYDSNRPYSHGASEQSLPIISYFF
mmetsp:Transcript_10138/g.21493  ORF Transcript_10138/g.21493 Transcript_10138/m.21493 type:complete len:266 (+) Transcript_10138:627-1424(+)